MHLVKGATQAAAVGAALLLGTSAYTVSFAATETAAKASISPEFVWLLVGLLFGLGCFVLLLLANIAKRRRAENELLKYKRDLEAKVERRTVQLSTLNQNLADQIDIAKKSEEVLRENERKLALLFGNLPGMVYRAERKKRWQLEFVSGGCETLTGYTPDELLEGDRRFYTDTVMAEDDRAHVRKEIFEAASAGEPYRVHYKVHTKEGVDRWVWDQGQGVFDADGKLIALEGFVGDLTERVQVEENLRESEERYRGLVEASPDAIIVHQDGQIVFLNNAALDLLHAKSVDEVIGAKVTQFVHPDYLNMVLKRIASIRENGGVLPVAEEILLALDGTPFYAEVAGRTVTYEGLPATQLVVRDITKRKHAEEGLRVASTVFNTTTEGIMVSDAENRIRAINPAFSKITGYEPEEVIGENPSKLSSGRHEADFYERMWASIGSKGFWEGEIWNRRKNGETYPEWLTITVIRDEDGHINEYVGVFTDITKRKQDEEQILRQANYDSLTGLPSRSLFFDRLKTTLAEARRDSAMVALLFIDLDHFKVVNDTMGHVVGDRLLQLAADRLSACVRESDTVARFGGDEFTVILREVTKAEDAAVVAEKIIESLSESFILDGRDTFIGASVGITIYPYDADDVTTMLRNADMAMYQAKDLGRNAFHFYTPEMNTTALQRMVMEGALRRAVENEEFVLHYQPVIETASGRVVAAEALVRWEDPEAGLMMPDRFIGIAEETGLIAPVGEWVLTEALRQTKEWHDAGFSDLGIAVNLSNKQIKRGLDRQKVEGIIASTGFDPSKLTLEITETLVMEDTEHNTAWMQELREMGIRFSIDDFGTGYSSLSYLKRLPADSIKVDRTFIKDLFEKGGEKPLVEAIIAMAHSLELKVTAEGVEDARHVEFLEGLSCDYLQGFYFSKPLTPEAFLAVLEEQRAFATQG